MFNYYFITTLKSLDKNLPMPIDIKDFIKAAYDYCPQEIVDNLEYLDAYKSLISSNLLKEDYWSIIEKKTRSNLIKNYALFKLSFNFTLSKFYEKKYGLKPLEQEIIFDNGEDFLNIMHLISSSNAVVTQNLIHEYFWQKIENLKPQDPFHEDHIYAYFLHMQLLDRKYSYNEAKGQQILFSLRAD